MSLHLCPHIYVLCKDKFTVGMGGGHVCNTAYMYLCNNPPNRPFIPATAREYQPTPRNPGKREQVLVPFKNEKQVVPHELIK